MRIHLTNDLQTQWQGEIRWRLMRLDGEVLDAGVMSGSVAPLSSSQVFEKDFSHLSLQEKRETVFIAHLFADGEVQIPSWRLLCEISISTWSTRS
jgi:hypothetical protein